MSSPNPLIPQGSLLEQQAKSKSTFHVAALIVGLHVFLLGGLLIIGCKREEPKPSVEAPPITDSFAPVPVITETNLTDTGFGAPPAGDFGQVPTNTVPPVTYEAPYSPISAPLTEAPAVEQPMMATSEYEVKKGDIAGRIASRHHVTLKQMQEANPGVDLSRIRIGQKLLLPAGAAPGGAGAPAATESVADGAADSIAYTVKGGDTLTRLAKRHGTTIKAIRAASGLKSNDLKIGQKIKIPVKAAPAPAAAEPVPPAKLMLDPAPAPTLPVATPILPPGGGTTPR